MKLNKDVLTVVKNVKKKELTGLHCVCVYHVVMWDVAILLSVFMLQNILNILVTH